MADIELLPCAHCGVEPMLEEHPAHSHSVALQALVPGLPDHPGSWTIECPTNGCVALIGDTCADVITAWNRREPLASRPAELVDERLLALPAPEVLNFGVRGYTAEQYRQGQLDAREYQRKVDGKIIARRNETIADLRFNIGELMKVVAPSHAINKDGN